MMLIRPHVGPTGTLTCNIGCSEHALEWWNNVSPFCFNVSFHGAMETWMLAGACITNLYTHVANPTLMTASSLPLCPRRLWGRRMCSLSLQMWGLSLGTCFASEHKDWRGVLPKATEEELVVVDTHILYYNCICSSVSVYLSWTTVEHVIALTADASLIGCPKSFVAENQKNKQ
jgi:hypothetical protein